MSKRTIWAIVAASVVLAVVLAVLYLPPQEICEPAKQVGQEQCAAYSFPLFLIIQIGEFLDRHNGLIIAAFTGTLWWSTYKLWLAGEKQLAHSEDTAKRQLRAYMGILDYDIKPLGEDDDPNDGMVMVAMQNFGQTPAIAFTAVVSIGYRPWDGKPKKPAKWAWTGEKLPIDVPPGGPMHRQVDFKKHGFEHYFDLLHNKVAIYIQIAARYTDIYGRRHDQTTCFFSSGIAYKSGIMQVLSQTREKTTEPNQGR